MQDRPTAHELLDAVRRFLEDEVVPHAEGQRAFLARVAANAVRIVAREMALEDEHLVREWEGLDALLGPQPIPEAREARRLALARRSAVLCERIHAGEADTDPWRSQVLAHVQKTLRDKLAVSEPGWIKDDK
ncbi:MAG: hypothetical protein A2Y95_00150 [Deltaproteobacteria bacterium RBG_13_65_10]|jgi:hypothetical protein|nr:MAG: hypothetical protein A2Y95_00150 [Deltaproteobacteria bacterium RBG_13_65_10]